MTQFKRAQCPADDLAPSIISSSTVKVVTTWYKQLLCTSSDNLSFLCMTNVEESSKTFWWLSAKMQCISNGDTTVLFSAINLLKQFSLGRSKVWQVASPCPWRKTRTHKCSYNEFVSQLLGFFLFTSMFYIYLFFIFFSTFMIMPRLWYETGWCYSSLWK